MKSIETLFRPAVQALEGYIPGEQPQDAGWTKLNTNENPFPPTPAVVAAMREAAESSLNKYPDPLVTSFRKAAAELFDVDPEWVIPGNGSDEILTILFRTFVDPHESIAFPYPSYVLYGTLAEIQGSKFKHLALNADWSLTTKAIATAKQQKMVLIPNPNSPSGTVWTTDEILELVPDNGVLVHDEAYGDFRAESISRDLLDSDVGKQIIVTRTLSKSYSLAGIRFGFAVAHPEVIAGMRKVKDSYNCDAISIAAATAAIKDQQGMREHVETIRKTRQSLTASLEKLGFYVQPSQANFVWTTHPERSHAEIFEALKKRKILVRFMKFPNAGPELNQLVDGLRITIGTDEQIATLVNALQEIM
ncbi:MAG TPA: histidinol-phosphate transaminase [Planctomycetaceae bacterium]|nr:histidinol-phosphate transaminase [Planctomycetaceae bacterium]